MNMRIINDISNFIFVEDELEKADAIFIPGGSYPELPERAAALWKEGYAEILVPSGAYSITLGKFAGVKSQCEKYSKDYITECEFYTDVLQTNGVSPDCIIPENKALFTAENARLTRKVLDERNIRPKKAIICCKAFHARRCLMYYQFSFPDTTFLIAPVAGPSGINVTRDNWYKTESGLKRVLGELNRLGTQFGPEFTVFKEEN
uniref:YdcF family protein n=1 Tax=Acetatifactor sp. TaxID=1872090 RepID=UPI004056D783